VTDQSQQNLPMNVLFSTITMKSRLVIPKTKKKGDQKNLLINYIFLKVVVNNIHNTFGLNNFAQ